MNISVKMYKSYKKIVNDIDKIQRGLFCRILPPELCNTTYMCDVHLQNSCKHYCLMFGPTTGYIAKVKNKIGIIEKYFDKLVRIHLFPFGITYFMYEIFIFSSSEMCSEMCFFFI